MANKVQISKKVYQIMMLVTAALMILNIAGLWVTWNNPSNAFGYVCGALSLVSLILTGTFALLNKNFITKRQCVFHYAFALAHLIFFIIIIVMATKSSDKVAPALFTVLLVAILAVNLYFVLKDRLGNKNKPYNLGEEEKQPEVQPEAPKDEPVVNTIVEDAKVEQPVQEEPKEPAKTEEIVSL